MSGGITPVLRRPSDPPAPPHGDAVRRAANLQAEAVRTSLLRRGTDQRGCQRSQQVVCVTPERGATDTPAFTANAGRRDSLRWGHVRVLHRTFDHIDVPTRARVAVTPDFRAALVTGVLAIIWFGVVGSIGNVHAHALHTRLLGFGGAAAFLILAALAVRSAGNELHRVLAPRVGASHASVVRLLVTIVGLAIAILATLGLIAVPVGHLLLGGALTGVIVGIAAQQALGNVFAGLVLLLARPFNVGDAIRIRSGSLGGELTGTVTGMGLTYVTLDTSDGMLSVPNNVLLSAGIGPQPDPATQHLDLSQHLAAQR